MLVIFSLFLFLTGCGSTQITESPKTTFVSQSETEKDPVVIWTSRAFGKNYDYLGRVRARSLTYDGAMERLVKGGKELRADALIDVHYEQVGFLTDLQAFAIKYR